MQRTKTLTPFVLFVSFSLFVPPHGPLTDAPTNLSSTTPSPRHSKEERKLKNRRKEKGSLLSHLLGIQLHEESPLDVGHKHR